MNFCFIPSALHMSAVKIALNIYCETDIQKLLKTAEDLPYRKSDFDRDKFEIWQQIEAKAAGKLPFLPDSLKRRVSKFIRPLHEEIHRWLYNHDYLYGSFPDYMSILCWKNVGIINRTQTAKKLVRSKKFAPETRFAIACTYFFEDEVLALWHGNEMLDLDNFVIECGTSAALRFWVNRLQNGSWRDTPWKAEVNEYFQDLLISKYDNRLRISCFFPYLSREGKHNYLYLLRWYKGYSDDFLLCMREMDGGELEEAISVYPVTVLFIFLHWPLQSFFIDKAKQLWHLMNFNHFEDVLLLAINEKILMFFDDFDYVGLVKEFWHLSPPSYKRRMKKRKRLFKLIELTLNYDEKNASVSLPEIMEEALKTCPENNF